MEKKLSLADFARRMRVDIRRISEAVQNGVITAEVDENGDRYVIYDKALYEWENNRPKRKLTKAPTKTESDLPTLTDSKRKKDHYLAEKYRMELELFEGTLVQADDVKKGWEKLVITAKTKILSIPSKLRQRMPELTQDQYDLLESIVRESLEDLSNAVD